MSTQKIDCKKYKASKSAYKVIEYGKISKWLVSGFNAACVWAVSSTKQQEKFYVFVYSAIDA